MHAKRIFTVTALGLSLLLSGCGILPAAGTPAAPPTPAPLVGAAAWIPSTFSTNGIWIAATDDKTPLASGISGIASITGHIITVRDGATGAIKWSSAGLADTPALAFASDGGQEYLLAIYGNGSPDARIDAYLTTHSGEGITPQSSTRFSGDAAGKVRGQVSIKPYVGGALVSTGSAAQLYRPGHQDSAAVSAQSIAAVNDSTLVADSAGNFWLESLSGAKVWSSASIKPPGAAPGSRGTFLGVNGGLIVAKWPGVDGGDLAVLIRAVGGVVAASAPLAAGDAPGALLASSDGRWAVYGHHVFSAATGATYDLPADLKPALVDRSVVYSSDAHGNAYDPIGKYQIPSPNGAPKLVTNMGQGVFLNGTEMTVAQMNTLGAKQAG